MYCQIYYHMYTYSDSIKFPTLQRSRDFLIILWTNPRWWEIRDLIGFEANNQGRYIRFPFENPYTNEPMGTPLTTAIVQGVRHRVGVASASKDLSSQGQLSGPLNRAQRSLARTAYSNNHHTNMLDTVTCTNYTYFSSSCISGELFWGAG
jgi:hypothetical protein